MFFVFRFNINKSGVESHSEQKFEDYTQSMKRFYNILAADIDNDNFLYELVMCVSESGSVIASQVFDNRENGGE